MYRVLLVDDEPWAIKSLKYLLDWEKLGYTVAGEASNGERALEMFRGGSFSLIVTDMKMPVMDGVTFIAEVRSFSDVPIAVMSGYEEFAYVKQAMSHGVKDYLLKPVEAGDLERVLKAVKSDLNQSRALELGSVAMKERIAREWVTGYTGGGEAKERLKLFGVELRERLGICCLLAEVDIGELTNAELTDSDLNYKRFAARNVIEEVAGQHGFVFEDSDFRFGIVITSAADPLERKDVLALAGQIKEYTEKFAKVGMAVGVGSIVYDMKEAAESFALSRWMLDQQFFFGKRMVISAEQMAAKSDNESLQDWNAILQTAGTGDFESFKGLLESQWRRFAQASISPNAVKSMVLELYTVFFRLVREQGGDYESLFNPRLRDYERIMEAGTLDELYDMTWSKYRETSALLRRAQPQTEGAVDFVVRWVDEHYGDNLSMRSIASQVYMNAAYLGQLFKAEKGVGFNDYLFQVRMENAKRMLAGTDMKVYEVAQAVGYNDLDWFYKKFKKYTGMSSSEYRTAHAERF
ncbi:Helix-turn-helix domain-containing protein [Paenibacillus sp. UNCCL117]|uniref:response regulator transcription factor n=1 Tax=unclassified Paenibacillus TaxID=185978 RepID=UPI00088528A0|nr:MULTISPECIES: response regulator [unclassified Paenibacillus]SDD24478.1 two component transcriptional regulator, AraC family [Paenibacillus sp. cl123]SFW41478.1 Helix-turn-helix domain-containing protein [Paenibacillus sp. UNCCL117]